MGWVIVLLMARVEMLWFGLEPKWRAFSLGELMLHVCRPTAQLLVQAT